MAEIPNSDSPSPFSSSPGPRTFSDDSSLFLASDDSSSILADTDDDEDNDDDTGIDEEGEEEEEDDDDDDFNARGDGEEDDDDNFDDFDWDMREVDFDGVGFLVDDEDHPGVEDYPDFADDDPLALHHALIHLVHDHWVVPPHSPIMDMDQPHGAAAARARTQRDQLVEVEVAGQGSLADPGAGASVGGAQPIPRQPPPDVIDLTGDDDLEMPARPVPHRQSENQRRLRSQIQNAPPRLNRSDGNYVDDQHIIVLSSSDDEDQPMRASPRRNAHNNPNPNPNSHHHHHHHRHQPGPAPPAPPQPGNANHHGRLRPFSQIMQLQNIPLFQFLSNRAMANRNPIRDDDLVITGERNIGNPPNHNPANPMLEIRPIQLDYAGPHPFPLMPPIGPIGPPPGGAGAGPPKPVHEPPAPARPGFTRDTGEDVVAICPSCDQELAYDPEADDDNSSAPTRKPRSRKAMAEHHFWAVKACGHVYCKRCFDNRRSTSRNTVHVSFRHGGEGGKKLFCAVEDCDSEVTLKTAWVGIFM